MTRTIVATETVTLDFWNLKNKATGPRRYGCIGRIIHEEGRGYRSDYQTTLDGVRYQSSKGGPWRPTADEALADLKRTIAGAIKRYAKLAQKLGSGIGYRTPLAADTTCKLAEADDKAKAIEAALLDRYPGLKGKLIVC